MALKHTVAVRSVRDWDGARFDGGEIVDVVERDGHRELVFDRWTWLDASPPADGPALREEPVSYYNTGVVFENKSPKRWTFAIADDAEVLAMDRKDMARGCDQHDAPKPTWIAHKLADIVAVWHSSFPGETQTSLTYSADGFVTRIRFSYGC